MPRDLFRPIHDAIPPVRCAGSNTPSAAVLRERRKEAMALRISLIGRDGRASDRRFAEQLDATIATISRKLVPSEARA